MFYTHLQEEDAKAAAAALPPVIKTRYVTRYQLYSNVLVLWTGELKHRHSQSKGRGCFYRAKVCAYARFLQNLPHAIVHRAWFLY